MRRVGNRIFLAKFLATLWFLHMAMSLSLTDNQKLLCNFKLFTLTLLGSLLLVQELIYCLVQCLRYQYSVDRGQSYDGPSAVTFHHPVLKSVSSSLG